VVNANWRAAEKTVAMLSQLLSRKPPDRHVFTAWYLNVDR